MRMAISVEGVVEELRDVLDAIELVATSRNRPDPKPDPDPVVTHSEPVTPAPARPAPDPGHENLLDSDGIPWDDRVHSSSKVKNKDGRWRRKKGVSTEDYEKFKASLVAAEPESAPTTPMPVSTPEPEPEPEPELGSGENPAQVCSRINGLLGRVVAQGLQPAQNTIEQYGIPRTDDVSPIVTSVLKLYGVGSIMDLSGQPVETLINIEQGIYWVWPQVAQ